MSDVNIEHRLGVLEKQVSKLDEYGRDTSDRVLVLEKNCESICDKIDGLSKHTEAIVGMSYEVKNLAGKVTDAITLIEKQDARIDEQDDKIDEIKDKPGNLAIKGWFFIASAVGTSILGVIIGYFIK